jgi:hypothetical protein
VVRQDAVAIAVDAVVVAARAPLQNKSPRRLKNLPQPRRNRSKFRQPDLSRHRAPLLRSRLQPHLRLRKPLMKSGKSLNPSNRHWNRWKKF